MKKIDSDIIWEEFVKDIEKMETKEIVSPIIRKEIKINPNVTAPNIIISKNNEELDIGSFDNVDKNTARKFRRGEFGVEAELDLHGYTESKAYDAVINFVKNVIFARKAFNNNCHRQRFE